MQNGSAKKGHSFLSPGHMDQAYSKPLSTVFSFRRRMKARAPPPPNYPPTICKVNNETLTTDVGMLPDQGVIYMKDLINRTMDFTVVFPNGQEQNDTVHGR